jgi:di/tricarboxylate transporter
MVPLAVSFAQNTGTNPAMSAMVIGLTTSNSFLLPTHQVNALYMGPGGYNSADFLKAGAPLSILISIAVALMVYFFY